MPMQSAFQDGAKTPTAQLFPQADLASLRALLANLQAQRSGLQTELAAVNQQLKTDKGSFTNNVVQAKASEVALQIAHIDGDIARVRAQIGALPGQNAGTTETPQYNTPINPDLVLMGVMFTLAFPVVIAISIILVKRLARGGRPTGDTTEVAGRLERLEHAVDTIAVEVERISEGQRFVTKILSDHPAPVAALSSDPNPDRANVR